MFAFLWLSRLPCRTLLSRSPFDFRKKIKIKFQFQTINSELDLHFSLFGVTVVTHRHRIHKNNKQSELNSFVYFSISGKCWPVFLEREQETE